MHFIADLWMPIAVSAVLCFIASAAIWMVGPHHKKEWARHPNEDALLPAMRGGNAGPGAYIVPMGAWQDAEAMAKAKAGVIGTLWLRPGGAGMGPMMVQQLAFFAVAAVFVAYVAHHALPAGAPYLKVHQLAGAVAFMTYGFGDAPMSIWFGRPWKSYAIGLVDALIYAVVTGGTFGWLWPNA